MASDYPGNHGDNGKFSVETRSPGRRRALTMAIAAALGLSVSIPGSAQFPAEFDLAVLETTEDDTFGFRLLGETDGDLTGQSVSAAGDINGDGIDDLIIGAPGADPNGNFGAGRSYVVFGRDGAFPGRLNLSTINGVNGFVLDGEEDFDRSGTSVSAAGDINGDGIDDLIIGAGSADPNGNGEAGRSYVVFGSASGLPSPFALSTVNGLNGFVLNGEGPDDRSGFSVSAAGDINGDGIDDLIIGAYRADPNGNSLAGRSYVVFGSASGLPSPFDLSTVNGLNGFVLNGEGPDDRSGRSVSAAGDINGDGIGDLIIGAPGANPNGNIFAGRSYVVFGSASGLPSPIDLSTVNGLNGFVLNGDAEGDFSGRSVGAAGDINDDGIDDLIIGANGNSNAGRSYVVFGSASGLPSPFDLSTVNGLNGFVLNGETLYDFSGTSVSGAGDINGDGIDDLIIGAPGADQGMKYDAGRSYVVFGSASGLPNPLDPSSLDGSNGFRINGALEGSRSGSSVSSAGDINGDGVDDLIIGAEGVSSVRGRAYVIYGRGDRLFSDRFEID